MISFETSMMQFKSDSSVAIAAYILSTDLFYGFLLTIMFLWLKKMAQMIVEAAPGEVGCFQELS